MFQYPFRLYSLVSPNPEGGDKEESLLYMYFQVIKKENDVSKKMIRDISKEKIILHGITTTMKNISITGYKLDRLHINVYKFTVYIFTLHV